MTTPKVHEISHEEALELRRAWQAAVQAAVQKAEDAEGGKASER